MKFCFVSIKIISMKQTSIFFEPVTDYQLDFRISNKNVSP